MDAKEYSKGIIKEYDDLVDSINNKTDKRIPITQEEDDMRNDLSRLWLALVGNPHTKDGSFKHGQPRIYDLMESYHQAKSKEEAEWISVNIAMPGYDSNGEPRECLLRNDFNDEVLNGYFDENKWWIERGGITVGHYPIDSFDIDFKITHWNLAAFGKEGEG